MEEAPYQPVPDAEQAVPAVPRIVSAPRSGAWRDGLPELAGSLVTLREFRMEDATSLFTAMTNGDVTRFISPPPNTVDGFERFIAWTHRQRATGQSLAFAIVERGSDVAIGLFQVRALDPDFGTAEWGFAIASEFWGRGMFLDGAPLVIEFAFDVIGVHRLEARAAVSNTRGQSALKKLGAVREGVLRKSFLRYGEFHDQALWALLADEWYDAQMPRESQVIH